MLEWSKTDPRFNIGKYAEIVIVRPDNKVGFGSVDTKNDWSIITSFEDYKLISVDDEWNEDWYWIFMPGH